MASTRAVPEWQSQTGSIPISIMVFTLNEELHLPSCLGSLAWCDDVIVIDTFSTDGTERICHERGVRFVQHPFEGFGTQRNWALDNVPTKHPWVLILDADERISDELAREMVGRLRSVASEVGGLENLLRAWKDAQSIAAAREWILVIAGWDRGGHARRLQRLAAELGIARSLRFVGPQFDDHKAASLACADAFVLPSLSEGLPVAVLEAWSYGLPVLMTEACNLPEGFVAGAALPIGTDPAGIAAGLRRLFALSDAERRGMGARGRALVRARFAWASVGEQMAAVYRWVLGGGSPPSCVLTH